MTLVVLDASALDALAGGKPNDPARRTVQNALAAAARTGSEVVVTAAVLSELYRGDRRDSAVDSCLGRHNGIRTVDTTRALARQVGRVLARSHRDSRDHVDATVVAAAIAGGRSLILTSDQDDLTTLAAGSPGITVERI